MNMKWRKGVPLIMAATTLLIAHGQETQRDIVPEEVIRARPKAAIVPRTVAKSSYRRLKSQGNGKPAPISEGRLVAERELGVTIWRLREARVADTGPRLLVQSEGNTTALIPERVASNTVLSEGDRVRVSVESPESGYLYVIDRELYSAGEHGNPFLIFPTTRALGGNNKVSGGELIDIPGQDDSPNFFTIKRSRSDHAGEELTLLLTMQPLTVTAGAGAQELSPEVVAVWEKQGMGSKVTAFELSGGAGKAWTESEQRAGQDGTRLLTQEDPPPQTVYRVESRAGAPLLVRVRLRCSTR